MLTDDTGDPDLRTTAMLASTALDRGWQGRVTACHARAIGLHPRPRVERLVRLAHRAGMAFVTNPHTAPLALPVALLLDTGLPVALLLDAGLPVALGRDDVADAYYPVGQHNLLEVGLLAAHALDMTSPADMERVLDMITLHPRTTLGLDADALAVGDAADLVVLDGSDARQVLTRHGAPRHVVRAGPPVAATVTTSDVPEPTRVATTSRRPG